MTGAHLRMTRLCLLGLAIPAAAQPATPGEADDGVRRIGSRLELFVDDWLIETMTDARQLLHRPVPREVVFTFDAPWEGGQSGYVTLIQEPDHYRMYYRGGGDLVREYTCVAFSDDAVHWTRPELGLFEFEGSRQNNIIWTGEEKAYWESHNFSPFKDTNPAARPEERYKAVTLGRAVPEGESERRKVLFAFVSPDGIHWKRMQDRPIITTGSFDSHNVAFWDAQLGRYVCYSRTGQQGKRSVNRCVSEDFVHWSEPELLDFGGTPIEHFYTNGIEPYFRAEHIYVGFPMRFIPPGERGTVGPDRRKTDGLSDAVFMSSRDGLHWHREFMEAFIRPGPDPKNWGGAHGNSTPAWHILRTDEHEISIYWTEHYDNYPKDDLIPQMRRGTLRLDGFVSVNAPYGGGEMVTRPLIFAGRYLTINYATSAVGSVRVEIQDTSGRAIPSFTLADASEIWGDEISRVVTWKKGPSVSSLAGRPVRLRFVMKDADLFAIQFADHGRPAVRRGGREDQ